MPCTSLPKITYFMASLKSNKPLILGGLQCKKSQDLAPWQQDSSAFESWEVPAFPGHTHPSLHIPTGGAEQEDLPADLGKGSGRSCLT